MIAVDNNFYTIEKSDDVLWYIKHDMNRGIIYSIAERNKIVRSGTLLKGAKKGFSAELLSKEAIAVIYEDIKGSLMLYLFNEVNWKVYSLIGGEEGKGINSFYKIIGFNNKLYLFYALFVQDTSITYLVYHIIDGAGNLSSPIVIDELNYKYEASFYLEVGEDKALHLLYQRYRDNHQLGYRSLQEGSNQLSEFKTIDTDVSPFKEYSCLKVKDSFYCVYLKKEKDFTSLQLYREKDLKELRSYIIKERTIISCTLFIIDEVLWVSWIESNYLFSSYSINNGESFNLPPQGEALIECKVYKGSCRLKTIDNAHKLYIREAFFIEKDIIRAPILDDIYQIFSPGEEGVYDAYIRGALEERISKKEHLKEMENKDVLIMSLYKNVEECNVKIQGYDKKLRAINSNVEVFNKNKKELNAGITYLQDCIIEKEKRLNELELSLLEKEEELNKLKNKANGLIETKANKTYFMELWKGIIGYFRKLFQS